MACWLYMSMYLCYTQYVLRPRLGSCTVPALQGHSVYLTRLLVHFINSLVGPRGSCLRIFVRGFEERMDRWGEAIIGGAMWIVL